MKKYKIVLNDNIEKIIAVMSVTAAWTILFGTSGKSKKKSKGFFPKVINNYKVFDNIISSTVAKNVKKNEQIKAKQKINDSYSTKLKNLEIENAIPFEMR